MNIEQAKREALQKLRTLRHYYIKKSEELERMIKSLEEGEPDG